MHFLKDQGRFCRDRRLHERQIKESGGKIMMNYKRYQRVPVVHYPEREWPNKEIEKAPAWCSVDLRDGKKSDFRRRLRLSLIFCGSLWSGS